MVMVSLKPESIPLNVKVLLIGDSEIYHTLLALDPDFRKLFKVKAEFEESAPRNDENIQKLAKFIHSYCERYLGLVLTNDILVQHLLYLCGSPEGKRLVGKLPWHAPIRFRHRAGNRGNRVGIAADRDRVPDGILEGSRFEERLQSLRDGALA